MLITHFFSSLASLNETLIHPHRKSMPVAPKFDLIQLSSYIQTLASSLFTYFKQTSSHLTNPSRHLSIQLELTEGETCALEVRSKMNQTTMNISSLDLDLTKSHITFITSNFNKYDG